MVDAKMDLKGYKDVQSALAEIDTASLKILADYRLIEKSEEDQYKKLMDKLWALGESGKLSGDAYNLALKMLKIQQDQSKEAKTMAENVKAINDGFGNMNKILTPLGAGLTSLSGSMKNIATGAVTGNWFEMIGGVLEIAVDLNKQFVEMNKNAIQVAASLGTLATSISGGNLKQVMNQYVEATKSLTWTYGPETTKGMLAAGAGIGIRPEGKGNLENDQYIGAVATMMNKSYEGAAKEIADISVKTGQELGYSAVVFEELGTAFNKSSTKLKMSAPEYVDMALKTYESSRLYGVSMAEAVGVTNAFAEELRSGTLSAENLGKVLSYGGRNTEQTMTGIGWLAAMGMSVPGIINKTGGGAAQVSQMNPLAQEMAIFTHPDIQREMIVQLMQAGKAFGERIGGGAGTIQGDLMTQWGQKMFLEKNFGVNLGSAEWKTFQEKVIPQITGPGGIPVDEALANAGLQNEEQTLRAYVTEWGKWKSMSLSWEDRIESILQVVALSLKGALPTIINLLTIPLRLLPNSVLEAATAPMKLAMGDAVRAIIDPAAKAKQLGLLTPDIAAQKQQQAKDVLDLFTDIGDMGDFKKTLRDQITEIGGATNWSGLPSRKTRLPGSNLSLTWPAYANMGIGGPIPDTGPYLLHKGETVFSPYGRGGDTAVTANVSVTRLDDNSINMIADVAKQKVIAELRRKQLYEPMVGV